MPSTASPTTNGSATTNDKNDSTTIENKPATPTTTTLKNGSAPPAPTPAVKATPKNLEPLLNQAIYTPRKVRVISVGAGVSGLTLSHKIRYEQKLDHFIDHVIYEKNSEIGGTWLENQYPGVACDVPSHVYTFLFEPYPGWTKFYASGQEIQDYLVRTVDKWDLRKNVTFNSRVIESIWDDDASLWRLKIQNVNTGEIFTDSCDILVEGCGFLNRPKMPDIKGLDKFKGHLVHTARWDHKYDFVGKRVGVIGNGCTGLQVVPALQKIVGDKGHLWNFIRSPTWVMGPVVNESVDDKSVENFEYTPEEIKKWTDDPKLHHQYRLGIERELQNYFEYAFAEGQLQAQLVEHTTNVMRHRLKNNQELMKKLIPTFGLGCRRISPGPGYLEALQEPNVTPLFGGIKEVTETGVIMESGEVVELDALICATGFDLSMMPHWKLIGLNGVDLAEKWKDEPKGLFGIWAPDMPNYMMMVGPNSPVAQGSFIGGTVKWITDYIVKMIQKIAKEDIRRVTIKPEVIDDWNVYAQEFFKKTTWADNCRSWYKGGKADGPVTAVYPGSCLHLSEVTQEIRGEDFNIEYRSRNRFRFLGDGWTQREKDKGDLTFYMYQ